MKLTTGDYISEAIVYILLVMMVTFLVFVAYFSLCIARNLHLKA